MSPVSDADPRRLGILVAVAGEHLAGFAVHGYPRLLPYVGPNLTALRLGGLFSVLVGHSPTGHFVVVDALPTEDGHAHGG